MNRRTPRAMRNQWAEERRRMKKDKIIRIAIWVIAITVSFVLGLLV